MDSTEISEDERKLLAVVRGTRKLGYPAPPSLREQVEPLMERGLVSEDQDGLFVPDEVLMQLWSAGRPLA
jgi:hypothetical protein